MKKLFPLVILTLILLLAFAGLAGAVVTEEPIKAEEGMAVITAITEEEPAEIIEDGRGETSPDMAKNDPVDNLSGEGVEGEVTITGIDGSEVVFDGSAEEAEQIRTLGYADMPTPGQAESANYLPFYAAAAAAGVFLALLAFRKKAASAAK